MKKILRLSLVAILSLYAEQDLRKLHSTLPHYMATQQLAT